MPRLITITALALVAVLLFGVDAAQAETWTGCVTPGGTIVHLAPGESPARRCGPQEKVIHLDDRHANQNPVANYDHAKVCAALLNAGADVGILTSMGCPNLPTLPPSAAIMQKVSPQDWLNNANDVCGILGVEQRPEWGVGYMWVVKGDTHGGGFVANHQKLANEDPQHPAQCQALCDTDLSCIAAQYNHVNPSPTGDCTTYHHSDTLLEPYHAFCGMSPGTGFGGCGLALLSENRWWIKADPNVCSLDQP